MSMFNCIETSKLNRTYRPLFNPYFSDGRGRDTYISYNNGGFWGKKTIPGTPIDGGRGMNMSRFNNNQSHYVLREQERLSPIFKYTSDGSGRDSYVIQNQGGLVRNSSMSLASIHLKDFLRTPDDSYRSIDSGRKSSRGKVSYMSTSQKKKNILLRNINGNVIQRLYSNERHKFLPVSLQASLTLRKKMLLKMPLNKSISNVNVNSKGCKSFVNFKKMSLLELKDQDGYNIIDSPIKPIKTKPIVFKVEV